MSNVTRHLILRAAVVLVCVATTFGCKPWTIRPTEATDDAGARSETFDAEAYVEAIWDTKVVPQARTSAIELQHALADAVPKRAPQFVRGNGTVVRVDRSSRVGLAMLDLEPGDGRADAALQIGPVIRGTAVRDALPFIRFGDFANQIAFADVANALNAQVAGAVLEAIDLASLEGRRLTFCGAAALDATKRRRPEVVPVILEGATQ